ncbi:MAG: TRAP transporter fused permease subunit [Acetobacterales bacterium]
MENGIRDGAGTGGEHAPPGVGGAAGAGTWLGRLLTIVAVAFALFHLYSASTTPFEPWTQRGIHLAGVLFLLYMTRPIFSGRGHLLNYAGAVLGAALCGYVILDQHSISMNAAIPVPWETPFGFVDFQTPFGIALILLLLLGAWRTIGPPLPVLAILALLYAYFGYLVPGEWGHPGFPLSFIIGNSYLSLDAIFGLPIQVSSTILALFVIFGSFLLRAGQSEFFSELALRIAGRTRGGPAQVATISSALVGTISGSAVGNVACTGAFSIPLMKARGYSPSFAGAVEAAASTGGQILPPVMGAGAFVMAETLQVPYSEIAIAATIPAIIYFLNIMASIHFEASRLGLRGLKASELPVWSTVLRKLYLLIPILVLVYFLSLGYSPMRAAIWAVWSTIAITNAEAILSALLGAPRAAPGWLVLAAVAGLYLLLPPTGTEGALNFGLVVLASTALVQLAGMPTQLGFRGVVDALREGTFGMIEVAAGCAVAGIVIGVINLTGLGIKLTTLIIGASYGYLFLALLLAGVASVILGMGLPTTVAYIIAGAVAAPALMEFGVQPIPGHLFVFYFSIVSVITPPVCLAAYVAAGIAGANWLETALIAVKIALPSFIVPFLFVYEPAFLLQAEWPAVVWSFATATFGILLLSAATIGYMMAPIATWKRVLFLGAALLLMEGTPLIDFAGAILAALLLYDQWRSRAPEAPGLAPGSVGNAP